MYALVKHHHNQGNEHIHHHCKFTCTPSKGFKKHLILKYFQKISLKNNTENIYKPFVQIHQFCSFIYFRCIGVTLVNKIM